jgi:hypothetical protein
VTVLPLFFVTDNQTDLYRYYFAIRELFGARWPSDDGTLGSITLASRLRAIVPRPLQQRSGGFLLELRLGSTVRVEINDICSKAGAEPCKRHGIIRRHRNKHLWAA